MVPQDRLDETTCNANWLEVHAGADAPHKRRAPNAVLRGGTVLMVMMNFGGSMECQMDFGISRIIECKDRTLVVIEPAISEIQLLSSWWAAYAQTSANYGVRTRVLSTLAMRPSARTHLITKVLLVSATLSAMPTGPVERVATIALSSQLVPGLVWGPHRPQALLFSSSRQLIGRCVQNRDHLLQ
eukprot:gene17841-biopygen410